ASEERPLPSQDVNALVDQALKQRPEIKQQEMLIRAAGYEVSIARKSLLPSVSLVGSVSDSAGGNFNGGVGSVGITLSWDPFSVSAARGRSLTAQADVTTAQQNLVLTTQTVQSDVAVAYLNDKTAEQQVQVSTAELANAQEGLRIAEGQYRAGVVTFVTVTDAETNIAQARADLVNAQAALQLARAAMEHALGKPLG
ncbi:MAG TPA: TolC family protein, partial [Fimbriimonas sp.]|nr:TolC family protein [Fimbriimonas sp.]